MEIKCIKEEASTSEDEGKLLSGEKTQVGPGVS